MARAALNTYLDLDQKRRLEALSRRTQVPQAALVRRAIEALLQREEAASAAQGATPEQLWAQLTGDVGSWEGTASDVDRDLYGEP